MLGISSYAASVRRRCEFGTVPRSSVEACFSEAIDSVRFLQILKLIANYRLVTVSEYIEWLVADIEGEEKAEGV